MTDNIDSLGDLEVARSVAAAVPVAFPEPVVERVPERWAGSELDALGLVAEHANVQHERAASLESELVARGLLDEAFVLVNEEGEDPAVVASQLAVQSPEAASRFLAGWREDDPDAADEWAWGEQYRQAHEADARAILAQAEREQAEQQRRAELWRLSQAEAKKYAAKHQESMERLAPLMADVAAGLDVETIHALGARDALSLVHRAAEQAQVAHEDAAVLNALRPSGAQQAFREINGVPVSGPFAPAVRFDAVRPDPVDNTKAEDDALRRFLVSRSPAHEAHKAVRDYADAYRAKVEREAGELRALRGVL